MEEQIHKHVNDRPDSIDIGTPYKGVAVKIQFDSKAPIEETKALIDSAFRAREYAKTVHAKQEG